MLVDNMKNKKVNQKKNKIKWDGSYPSVFVKSNQVKITSWRVKVADDLPANQKTT